MAIENVDNRSKTKNDGILYAYLYDIYFYAGSDTQCNNIMENNTGSGDRPIKFFNSQVDLQNEVLSELILCNADNTNIDNVTIIGSETLNNSAIIVLFTENSNFTNINSSNNNRAIRISSRGHRPHITPSGLYQGIGGILTLP